MTSEEKWQEAVKRFFSKQPELARRAFVMKGDGEYTLRKDVLCQRYSYESGPGETEAKLVAVMVDIFQDIYGLPDDIEFPDPTYQPFRASRVLWEAAPETAVFLSWLTADQIYFLKPLMGPTR